MIEILSTNAGYVVVVIVITTLLKKMIKQKEWYPLLPFAAAVIPALMQAFRVYPDISEMVTTFGDSVIVIAATAIVVYDLVIEKIERLGKRMVGGDNADK